jgi:hypothetical protein
MADAGLAPAPAAPAPALDERRHQFRVGRIEGEQWLVTEQ